MARIRAHPGLREAMRAAADGVVTLHDHNPLLNRILNDRGRTVFGFFVLYLDATADAGGMGLTTARMVALCQETGLCSRGRAKALLALMRWGGYLEPAAPRGDRRARPLAPTDRMRQLFQLRWRAQFSALRALGGAAEESLALLDEPEFFTRLAVCFGSVYRAGFRLLDHAPKLATICEHDGGMLVVFALVGAARSSGRAPTVTGLARRFSLSRTHALQILRHAEGIGLVVRAGMLEDGVPVDAGPGFALTAEGHAAVEDFVVAMFTLFECCARWALHAHRAARAA
ncbi:hypothetical protein [Xanthobacter sp. KR7-225]|uniref:hypothetical protein n=1 Tax=Xanthobacter sp. KR7-225 TaxID=3156613 RepID=UPI0032B3E9FE